MRLSPSRPTSTARHIPAREPFSILTPSSRMRRLRTLALATAATALTSAAALAQAGVTSNTATVSINATKVPSLTVVVNSGGTQTLGTLTDNAVNNFSGPVNITTSWDINPSASSVSLVAYFSTPAQALANGTDYIASSLVKGRVTTGSPTSYTAFSGSAVGGVGSAGGSLTLFTTAITGANKRANRTDNLDLQIDLTGQAPITAGTYTGTLNLRAVTQ
jgi:hypothetical protein